MQLKKKTLAAQCAESQILSSLTAAVELKISPEIKLKIFLLIWLWSSYKHHI